MTDSPPRSLFAQVIHRRIPQVLGLYLGGSWALIQFVDWIVHRYLLSPYLPELVFVILAAMIPTVFLLGWFHGAPDRQEFGRLEKVGIPINLVVTITLAVVLFQGKDLGATSQRVTVEDDLGNRIERTIPRGEFRKRLVVFPFRGKILESGDDWIGPGLAELVTFDLLQDIYFGVTDASSFIDEIRKVGFDRPDNLPLALQMKLARDQHREFLLYGEFEVSDGVYTVHTTLYRVRVGREMVRRTFRGSDIFSLADSITIALKTDLDLPERHIQNTPDLPVAEMFTGSPEACAAYVEGNYQFRFRNDPGAATEAFQRAIDADPMFVMGHLGLFLVHATAGRRDAFDAPLAFAKKHLYRLPELIQFQVKAVDYLLRGEDARRLAVLQMWTELYPTNATGLNQLASYYREAGEYRKAIGLYRRSLTYEPGNFGLLLDLAAMHRELGALDSALTYYQRYADQNPEDDTAFRHIGNILRIQGQFDRARASYEQALLIDGDNVLSLIAVSQLDRAEGKFDAALHALESALGRAASAVDSSRLHESIGSYYMGRGALGTAIAMRNHYLAALARHQEKLQVEVMRVFSVYQLARANRIAAARAELQDVQLIPPFDQVVHLGYLLIAMEMDDPDGIRSRIDPARDFATKGNFAWAENVIRKAECRLAMLEGRHKEALEGLADYRDRDPDDLLILLWMSECHRVLRRPAEGVKPVNTYLSVNPVSGLANLEMARLRQAMGQREAARRHLETALNTWAIADPDFEPAAEARELLAQLNSAG